MEHTSNTTSGNSTKMLKLIQNETEYKAALEEAERLLGQNPSHGTSAHDRLGVLLLLIKEYESGRYQSALPDPISAIRFRMDQQGLTQRDLIPYIGSRSKVSEVLSKKRPLTLAMIRALESGLGIPARVLLQDTHSQELEKTGINWSEFPLKEIINLRWVNGRPADLRRNPQKTLEAFFSVLPNRSPSALVLLTKRTNHTRSGRPMNKYALVAWATRVVRLAIENPPPSKFLPGTVDLEFMQRVARLSSGENGPRQAQSFLRESGISLVIERHLSKTYLDGATITLLPAHPIIGLTLRYDRLDNFWFCLLHELAHLSKHYDQGLDFFDDLEVPSFQNHLEKEADALAAEALIPHQAWIRSPASLTPAPDAAYDLANRLEIHPAIVAGRMRRERRSYKLLNQLVGYHEVKRLFPEVKWEDNPNV